MNQQLTFLKALILICLLVPSTLLAAETPITLYKSFEGNIGVKTIGNSELTETGGYSNCGNDNATTANLSLPAGATVKAAYLYWYAMTANITPGDNFSFGALASNTKVSFPGFTGTIDKTRNMSSYKVGYGGFWNYAGHFADVTSKVAASPNGNYTVDVAGGASTSACAYTQENVRAWSLIVVYDAPSITENKKIYLYDGMKGYLSESINIPVSGFEVPTTSTAGSLTVISIQGDKNIPGEYMRTSDTNFPEFPIDFADGDHGAALDIDTQNGNFTAGLTSMTLTNGSNQDLIFTTNIILTVPTVPTPQTTTLTLVAEVTNDDNGTSTLNDLGVTTSAGGLVFDSGTTSGKVTTYTSDPISINAGSFQLSANDLADYNEADWVCSGNGTATLTLNQSFQEGFVPANVTISAGDAVTCTISYDDIPPPACSALSGSVNNGLSPIANLKNGSKLFMASSDLATSAGHLKAFTIGSDGLPAATASWDANTAMSTQNQRLTRLYSTSVNGDKVLFKSLDDAAFGADGIPSNTTIKSSIGSAELAAITPHSNIALLENKVNVSRFLSDSAYKTYYSGTIATRSDAANATVPKLALVSSDDGFLYAFKQSNGDLLWGWTPRSLTKERRDAAGLYAKHLMEGSIETMDIKTNSSYASYVVGSYKNGLGQYVLKLGTDSTLDSIVWDEDHTETNSLASAAPNQGKRAYFTDGSGTTYMAYVISTSQGDSVLHIRSIADTSVHYQITLGYTATSTPFVMPRLKGGPAKNTLFIGDSTGKIYAAQLLVTNGNNQGSLKSEQVISGALRQPSVTSMYTSDSSPVRYIGASTARDGETVYLRAQSDDRLTVFKYTGNNPGWERLWSTYLEGAGKWTNNGSTLTADASITSLPASATISDEAFVIADSLILPVTTAPSANSCAGEAYYYFYRMQDGHVPTKTFYKVSDKSAITSSINLGKGEAQRLHVANHPGSSKLIGLGMAAQKSDGTTGINSSFYIEDPVRTGIRSWKELH